MTLNGWMQIAVFFVLVLLAATPMGLYMARVYERQKTPLDPILGPVERLLYKLTGVDAEQEMRWTQYASAMLMFSLATMMLTYAVERTQGWMGGHLLNPQHLSAVEPYLAWSTAGSFTTNTNWQAYVPETTMSYLTQMFGLAPHMFWSASMGMALAIAFIRGIARREMKTLGNFWVDLTRGTLWILAPMCVIYALVLVSQGVVQNFRPYDTASLVEAQHVTTTGTDGKTSTALVNTQTIAQGPVASQEAIKMLGTNGGGFFNANSAHPFENPTPLSNFLEIFSIFLIPAGLAITLGKMVGSPAHGWAVFAAMAVLWFAGVLVCYWAEAQPNPLLHGVDQQASMTSSGGNMEGKEVRFGVANSALFATVTTDASCGAVNSMHDSFMPLGGLVPMVNILLGEIVFGGVGSGMNAGVPGQEDPGVRRADVDALPADLSHHHSGLRRGVGVVSVVRHLEPGQQGSARAVGDFVRLYLGDRQQRLRVCRTQREHALVQREPGHLHAGGPIFDDRAYARGSGQSRDQEDRAAIGRRLPRDLDAVHGLADKRDPDRRRADVLSRAAPWPGAGAPAAACRHQLLAAPRTELRDGVRG
jgi:K+-transporting ATPase KdpA subunit